MRPANATTRGVRFVLHVGSSHILMVSTNKSSFHHFKYIFPIKRYGSTANWIMFHCTIPIYYTLRFYVPYLSLLARQVTIFVYGPVVYGPARYLH